MEYKGYNWKNCRDLSIKLDKADGYVAHWLRDHPDKSVYDCIDFVLDRKPKEYKGIRWCSLSELGEKLGVSRSTVAHWLLRHPGKTVFNYIDESAVKTYKGITWRNKNQLAIALGIPNGTIYNVFKEHPELTEESYIDYILSKKPHNGSYRGITWNDYRDLSRQLGKGQTYVGTWVCRNKDKPINDLIDSILGEEKESI